MTSLFQRLARSRALALADQAIVSGSSFAATVIIARFGGASELASYSLAASVLLLLVGAQNTVGIMPYVIQRRHHTAAPAAHAGSTMILNLAIAGLAALILAIVAIALAVVVGGQPAALAFAVAFAGPSVVAREFARRYAFAHLELTRAIVVDTVTMTIQLVGLFALGWSGWLTAEIAIAIFGLSCLVSAAGWYRRARGDFDLTAAGLAGNMRQSWNLGRWLLANQMIGNIQGYAPIWLSMAMLGSTPTGIYVACVSVVAAANPLIFGVDNVLTPRLSAAFAKGGMRELSGEAWRNAGLIAALVAAVSAAIWLFGDWLMAVFYPVGEFGGYHAVLVILALATAALALTLPATSALAVLERPREVIVSGIVSAAITIGATLILMQQYGLLGIALGTLTGNVSCLVARWAILLAEPLRPGQHTHLDIHPGYGKA